MTEQGDIQRERRRPAVRTLHQPVEPARVQLTAGGRLVLEVAEVVELTDRSVVLEARDAALADLLGGAREVVVAVDLGGAGATLLTSAGRRWTDRPTAQRVERVLRGCR